MMDKIYNVLKEMSKDNFQKLYDRGFEAEKIYFNCGQCVLVPFVEYLGFDEVLFKAGSGMAAGIGQMGDACGAYTGGALLLGVLFGRSYRDLEGDIETGKAKFRNACRLVREFREKFVNEYKGINCREVQTTIFGRSYNLLDMDKDFPAFEAAGGHTTKCTDVIGKTTRMIAEVMLKELEKQHNAN
ncbi:MAG: C-GCAxxG-C-C family protein [Peptococcaceae bacterium]|jgi:C_GCAxxG_C_C family probable redox protein|nr:C-GCAxxG-C-C family protein [Peptococcaceae bacterium]MDH7525381.1 C-GCAxxG-C-C family protein [Peptococcaceae bacterium]